MDMIPVMDHIHSKLTNSVKNTDIDPSLRAALLLSMNLLNKYYSLTDESKVY